MKVDKFELPFATVRVYKNEVPISFEISTFEYGTYQKEGSYKKPEGLYKITIDMNMLKSGDVLICELDCGTLQDDGGGEHTLNMVGVIKNYTVGIGTYDTADINECLDESKPWVPYAVWKSRDRGYEVRMMDDPQSYQSRKIFQQLYFAIAWEYGNTDDAWNLISFVTT